MDLPNGTAIDYVVDGSGLRVGKKVNGVLTRGWIYKDALKVAGETDGAGNLMSQFVYAKDTPSAHSPEFMLKGGATYRLVKDQVGSIRLVVNTFTGAVAQELTYDAWWRVLSGSAPGFQSFGFADGLHDPDTGLVRFGARDCDPEVGRWTARDPIRWQGGQANLYVYVGNDPIDFADPSGRVTPLVVAAVLAGGALAGGTAQDAFGDRGAADFAFGAGTGLVTTAGALTGSAALAALGI